VKLDFTQSGHAAGKEKPTVFNCVGKKVRKKCVCKRCGHAGNRSGVKALADDAAAADVVLPGNEVD
jgi:hypothetical protein